jgi:tetratricopeptide (TPR) repeat protein
MQNNDPIEPTSEQTKMIEEAVALHQSGQLDLAETQYKNLLNYLPNNPSLLTNLGTIALQKGRLEDGVRIIEASLKIEPNQINALNNLGTALQGINRPDEALASYDRAIALNPDYADSFSDRGNVLRDLKRLDEALASYDRAIALNPSYADAYYNRGIILKDLKRLDEALASFDRAIALNPDYADAFSNRGNTLQDLKRLDEALLSYDRAITLNPDSAEAYYNRGNALRDLKRLDEALASYDRAIALYPDYAEAFSNRGNTLQDLKRLDEALASYDCAIALKPDYAGANWNKSLLKLLLGEYLEGWKLYEWRWKKEQHIDSLREYHQPLWLGDESLINRTILIYLDQGFGDYIQCIRYAALVEQLGAKVILEVPLELMTLCSTLKGNFTLLESKKPLPFFDYHCPVMSLPLALKTTVETIPAQIPYLYANEEKEKQWNEILGVKTLTRIGLVWSGSDNHTNDHNRSMLLNQLTSLFSLPVEFHSIQKEVREIDIRTLTDFPNLHQHQEDLLDFSDTAALIDAMDLVISVDTSVAHLAGAMGKKTFILLPYSPDWRWMLDKMDSPWYPTATLFRQPAMGDWDSVIAEIRKLLSD